MTIYLEKRKQELLLEKYQNSISEIAKDYHEKEIYKIVYFNEQIEKIRYKFKVNKIIEKYNLHSQIELIFLISQAGTYLGICTFCGNKKFEYETRSSWRVSCECFEQCKTCKKVYRFNYGESEECHNCRYQRQESESKKPKTEQEELAHFYECKFIYVCCTWNNQEILENLEIKHIEWTIKLLQQKIKRFKNLKKVMDKII